MPKPSVDPSFFAVTPGFHANPLSSPRAVFKEFTDLNTDHKVRVNTIAFVGDGDNEVAFIERLKKIAKDSGGTYRHVKESDL